MKCVVEERSGEGLVSFLGQKVEIWCPNYIYAGTLVGVNDICIKLDGKDSVVVYETGPLTGASYKDAQLIGNDKYIMVHAIESFGAGK